MSNGEITHAPPAATCHLSAHLFERLVAFAVMVLGGLVLVGWAFDIQSLVYPIHGRAYMKPNTAVAFVISGCGLFLLQLPGKWPRLWARFCALIIGLIALLTLGEYASGLDFGIDQLLFRITNPTLLKVHLGRMSLAAVSCFGLTAAALWLMSRPPGRVRRPLILVSIGTLLLALGLFTFIGYLTHFITGYGTGDLTGMAVHTAFLFVLIGAAVIVFSWREIEGRWLIGRKLSSGFAFGLILMIAFSDFSQQSTQQLMVTAEKVQHTYEVIGKINELKGDYEEVAESERGFVITGDETFLRFTNPATLSITSVLGQLRQLIGNLEEQVRLAHLESAITASLEYSQQVIAARRDRGFDEAAQMIASGHGLDLIDRVRVLLHEMEAAEKELLELRRVESEAISKLTLFILPVAVFISVLLLAFVVLRLNVEAASKQRLIAELHHHAELLEVANKELEGFSYSVSHDLRAPLRAIDGFSRMIAEDLGERLDDDSRRMLNVIRSEAQRMSRLIDDLLAFSRLGRQQVAPEPIDMHAMAQEVFDELAALAPGRQLHLVLHPLPPAIGTPSMVRQAWVNLLSNAIKFTQGREPGMIEIGTQVGELGAPIYYVKDNGAGFDMRYADKLFGVFQRLHSGEKFEGTGIGLSLVKRIVERHGGRVWAEAEVDHGATFYFTLPNPVNPKPADPMHAKPEQHHE